jgi:hypothetical protein
MKTLGSAAAALLLTFAATPALADPTHVLPGFYHLGVGPSRTVVRGDFGYFRQDGLEPAVRNGKVLYDYDRGYPYDHYSGGPRIHTSEAPHEYEARSRECVTEWTHDRRTRQQVPVRVCRN